MMIQALYPGLRAQEFTKGACVADRILHEGQEESNDQGPCRGDIEEGKKGAGRQVSALRHQGHDFHQVEGIAT